MDRHSSQKFIAFCGVLSVLLALIVSARPAMAAPVAEPPATAPCYLAAIAALTKQGAAYSQGGAQPEDPRDGSGQAFPRLGPHTFDCSGLVWWSYAQAGVTVGLNTYAQANDGVPIPCSLSDLAGAATTCWALGDLAFLRYDGGQHVSIYVGRGLFMDCYNHATGCFLHDVQADAFYKSHWWQARRIVSGCEGSQFNPGTPTIARPTVGPVMELIPPLVIPIALALALPWTCSVCVDGQSDYALKPEPEPDISWGDIGSWIQWLGVQLWNRITLPVVCWMLAIAGALLDAFALVINFVFINAINGLWRVLVLQVLVARDLFLNLWAGLAALRVMLWLATGDVQRAAAFVLASGKLIAAGIQFIAEMVRVFSDMAVQFGQGFGYALAVFMQVIPAIITGLFNPVQPPQVAGLTSNVLFLMLRDALNGFVDSRLGWVWVAVIALFYIKFGLWLLDELETMNA